jgi:sec-independent protein translocase protein TatA
MKYELIIGMLLMLESPVALVLIAAVVFLLFGGSKLPQLAKALGQSKRSFKEGLADLELEEEQKPAAEIPTRNSLESIDDEQLFAEAQRRSRLRESQETKVGGDRKAPGV